MSARRPVSREQALRYNGVGKASLPFLEAKGLVCPGPALNGALSALSVRLRNIVLRAGFTSQAEVAAAIIERRFILHGKSGRVRGPSAAAFRAVRNCGRTSYRLIAAWAGVPSAEKSTTWSSFALGRLTALQRDHRIEALAAALRSVLALTSKQPGPRLEHEAVADHLRTQIARLRALNGTERKSGPPAVGQTHPGAA